MGNSIMDIFGLGAHFNKRRYSKNKIKDLDLELEMEIKKIENNPEKSILNVLHKEEENIIVYRTLFKVDEETKWFFIKLKVINKKGIVLNQIRLSAKYSSDETIELGDIEVFGENEGRGYGSLLLNSLINFASDNSIKTITGWISYADKDHFDRLDYFYKKHGFDVIWSNNFKITNKAANIIWSNPFYLKK